MPFQSVSLTVGATPVALASNTGAQPLTFSRSEVVIHNMGGAGSGLIYVGDSQVTALSGMAIASNTYLTVAAPQSASVYAVSNSGNQTVRVLEIG